MTKSKKDPIREERIHNEVVVDAYGAEEQAMGWYYYLEDKIRFPFQAECVVAKVVSPLLKGETVEVQGMQLADDEPGTRRPTETPDWPITSGGFLSKQSLSRSLDSVVRVKAVWSTDNRQNIIPCLAD